MLNTVYLGSTFPMLTPDGAGNIGMVTNNSKRCFVLYVVIGVWLIMWWGWIISRYLINRCVIELCFLWDLLGRIQTVILITHRCPYFLPQNSPENINNIRHFCFTIHYITITIPIIVQYYLCFPYCIHVSVHFVFSFICSLPLLYVFTIASSILRFFISFSLSLRFITLSSFYFPLFSLYHLL